VFAARRSRRKAGGERERERERERLRGRWRWRWWRRPAEAGGRARERDRGSGQGARESKSRSGRVRGRVNGDQATSKKEEYKEEVERAQVNGGGAAAGSPGQWYGPPWHSLSSVGVVEWSPVGAHDRLPEPLEHKERTSGTAHRAPGSGMTWLPSAQARGLSPRPEPRS
jgi:hypothetical protein